MNTLCFSRIYYLFREFNLNQFLSPNRYEFIICFAFHYQYTIFFANRQSSSQFHWEFVIFFAKSPWIHFFRQITMKSLFASHFTMNTLSFSRNHFLFREFTILIAISLWIHYLIPSLWIHYCFRDSLNVSYDS